MSSGALARVCCIRQRRRSAALHDASRGLKIALFFFASLAARQSQANLELIASHAEAFVFSGNRREIEVVLHNDSESEVLSHVRMRLYQATSATLAPFGEAQEWKNVRILPGQKIIEHVTIDFPSVRSLTAFQVRWLADGDREIGRTSVNVVPTNVLSQVTVLVSNKTVRLIGTEGVLKEALKRGGVKFEESDSIAGLSGGIAFIGAGVDPDEIKTSLKRMKHPMTALWFQHFASAMEAVPNLYFVQCGQARIAVADARLVNDLGNSAPAQINLLRCIRAAQDPGILKLTRSKESQR